MNTKAFLTSGDLTPSQVDSFKKLLNKRADRALIVTTAAVPYGLNPKPEWLERSLDDMRQFADIVDETSLEDGSFTPTDLSQYDFIFISGGNVFYLAYRLTETGFGQKVKKFIEDGGIYSGSSAGAIILMDNIKYFESADRPEIVPKICNGLGVIDFAIIPHADNEKYILIMKEISEKYKAEGIEIIFLNDDEVLIVDGSSKEVI